MTNGDHQSDESAATEPTIDYAVALRIARRFLSTWQDRCTVTELEDLAQEAVIELWRQRHRLSHEQCAGAFVCAVARRLRWKALRRAERAGAQVAEAAVSMRHAHGPAGRTVTEEPVALHAAVRVGNVEVDRDWLLATLLGALPHLPAQQRKALAGYYQGFDTAWIAARCGLPRRMVKLRLHRGRERLRRVCQSRIAVAERMGERTVDRVLRPTAERQPGCPERVAHSMEAK